MEVSGHVINLKQSDVVNQIELEYLDVFDLDDVELLQRERVLGVVDVADQVKNFALVKLVLENKKIVR